MSQVHQLDLSHPLRPHFNTKFRLILMFNLQQIGSVKDANRTLVDSRKSASLILSPLFCFLSLFHADALLLLSW